jgi:hypothetical protein
MWTLVGIATVVLVSFAIFVLQNDARDQKRDERPLGQLIDPHPFA